MTTARDRDKANAYRRAWRARNPDKRKAENKRAWAKNKEKLRHYAYRGMPAPDRPKPELCECCGRPPNGKIGLHLDHNHRTGTFRGWLCFSCNAGIGNLGDTLEGLQRAVYYLRVIANDDLF